MSEQNWGGCYAYQAERIHAPTTIEQLQEIVARSEKIHALGSRHSFHDIADSVDLVSLAEIEQQIEIDRDAMTVAVGGGTLYGALAQALEAEGLALHNLASLPHISVAGAVATATHGSGVALKNLSSAVTGLEMVTSSGEITRLNRGDKDFAGAVVGLGALGVVTRLTLNVEPTYQVRQQVFEDLDWNVALENFDDIMSSGTSVSLFTDFGADVNQVWSKNRVIDGDDCPRPETFYGARPATRQRHPIPDLTGESCTEQLGVPGPWLDRLSHFKLEFTPSYGAEIQSEYILPRHHAVPAITALRRIAGTFQPYLWVAEVRTVAADDLWLSTAYLQDSVCFHFTWRPDPEGVSSMLPDIEEALAPFGARPHWGKWFNAPASHLETLYERLPDFRRLAERLDERGAFRNAFLQRHVFGETT